MHGGLTMGSASTFSLSMRKAATRSWPIASNAKRRTCSFSRTNTTAQIVERSFQGESQLHRQGIEQRAFRLRSVVRGRALIGQSPEASREASVLFHEAIASDPNYAEPIDGWL